PSQPNANGELHISPLTGGVLQLRPAFNHVDTAIEQEKAMHRASRADPTAAPPVARAVTTVVRDNEVVPPGQEALAALRREEGEEWTGCGWVDEEDERSWGVYGAMFKRDGGEGKVMRKMRAGGEGMNYLLGM